jgi:hypothetical protein
MAEVLLKTMKHLKHFKDYIVVGYYPFFKDDEVFYYHKLNFRKLCLPRLQ